MRLHDLLQQVSDILAPGDGGFYNYLLHTSDDNGWFLRTRHQWWADPVRDTEIPNLSRVLLCFVEKLDLGGAFYVVDWDEIDDGVVLDRFTTAHKTLVKLELYFDRDDDDYIQSTALSAFEMGYKYAYVVDLTNKTYSVDTFPVIKHQSLIELELGGEGNRLVGGTYYDDPDRFLI